MLRTFVYLRVRNVSLQRVRKAVRQLRDMGETAHLSRYRLVDAGREVMWIVPDGGGMDLTGAPGQLVLADMVEILSEFRAPGEHEVVPLHTPKPGIAVDPTVLGGYPVIEGTRVPYDLVAALLQDGLSAEDVSAIYPSVGSHAARGASAFASYVDGYRDRAAA